MNMADQLCTPFSVEFEEYGGYDCMSSAYFILNGNGKFMFKVDCADHGNEAFGHGENEEAKAVAQFIVNAANEGTRKRDVSKILDELNDSERQEVFSKYCPHCGDKNPQCQCWNDE